jgi:hypothetical protein
MPGLHKQLPERPCGNSACPNTFTPTTRNKNQRYCCRSCIAVGNSNRSGKTHSEDTKRRISENRKGKCVGHPFWGNLDALAVAGRKSADRRRKVRATIACGRPDCSQQFTPTTRQRNKRYCSISCAQKATSTIGHLNRGRTPAEGSGRCKWYDYRSRLTGSIVRVQGSWELRVANCLDAMGHPWRPNHNRDRFNYIDRDGVQRSYAPDFWHDGTYIEVKGYLDPAAEHKIEAVINQGVSLAVVRFSDIVAWEKQLFGQALASTGATKAVLQLAT